MNDIIDHLQQATLRLSQEGSLKDRLIEAYSHHLQELDPSSLPEGLRAEFESLHMAMHSAAPLPRECVVRASVRKMSIVDVRSHAGLVVRAFAALARHEQAARASQRAPRAGQKHPVVSLFAEG
jgi:hypothetical protein